MKVALLALAIAIAPGALPAAARPHEASTGINATATQLAMMNWSDYLRWLQRRPEKKQKSRR
jgi:hypothetical protein